jgi:hypothetical protein
MRRVGFDRKIRIEWLDAVAGKMQNANEEELRNYLHDLLQNEHSALEARRKTVTVLMRIWFFIPEEYLNMREKALQAINKVSPQERLLIHWGMILLAYPFFRSIVSIIGKLCSLQGEFSFSQVLKDIEKSWGQRTTVERAVRRVIRSLYEWGVIDEAGERGVYVPSDKIGILTTDMELWLIEAVLKSGSSDFITFDQLHDIPCAFPFSFSVSLSDFFQSDTFEISQQGLNKGIITAK